MDIIRVILDGLAISAIFNGAVATLLLINPRFFLADYPKGIQQMSPTPMTRQEKKVNRYFTLIVMGLCFLYSLVSLLEMKIVGFWSLVQMSYIQWSLLNLGDFLLLDCLLFQGRYKERLVIFGTEGHEDYQFKNWMKHLALREHFFVVPFLLLPMISVFEAFLVGLLSE